MAISVYTCLSAFNPDKKLNGSNWPEYKQEFKMIFMQLRLFKHVESDTARPSDSDKAAIWDELEESALLALYSTMASTSLQARHVRPTLSSRQVWASLKEEFEGNNRARRMQIKQAFFKPQHDTALPISDYIQSIVNAADTLNALDWQVKDADIVDSIISNLDDSWSLVRTVLTTQSSEPKLDAVKATLLAHERETNPHLVTGSSLTGS
ncbi:hypothetical protein EXIGLDRAFT_661089 [Exidia glandulosa HHB12029]|uniref:Uncharacterized protein n=1 Tax=Exidia glandulosa HHB12029 TaxID=1314781 RepID=A0A165AU54_EXIGL|nr:hypothetical protein EXIGLDRAFT_661089 [Exidia glandulosa HHB12029]